MSSFNQIIDLYYFSFKGSQGYPFHSASYTKAMHLPKEPLYIMSQKDTHRVKASS